MGDARKARNVRGEARKAVRRRFTPSVCLISFDIFDRPAGDPPEMAIEKRDHEIDPGGEAMHNNEGCHCNLGFCI